MGAPVIALIGSWNLGSRFRRGLNHETRLPWEQQPFREIVSKSG